jgi:hypothetical protein
MIYCPSGIDNTANCVKFHFSSPSHSPDYMIIIFFDFICEHVAHFLRVIKFNC